MSTYSAFEFKKEIQKRLINLNQTQKWLIEEVKKDTGLYFDRSYMRKIMNGDNQNQKIIESICRILEIKKRESGD